MASVIEDVLAERARQDRQWGRQNHPASGWLAILVEEVGEVAKEVADDLYVPLRKNSYRAELVQVAAVAIAAIESFDRNRR